jgi:hypothetical protein
VRLASLDAPSFAANLNASSSGRQLVEVTGAPKCGVDFYYIQYATVGGAGEATTASGALMVPTGPTAMGCSSARPIVLYAHGTNTDKAFNIADITNPTNTEGALIAAMFAAQGYIVVAPNYAGYDTSSLPYHPYLNADQQSKDMIDALAAAHAAMPRSLTLGTTASAKLFITGYSQGGHVAMATHRAMQALGMPVTAAAPMSGPYALAALGDAVFGGQVNLGSTVFTPLLSTSYQRAYGNIYTTPSDLYTSAYAPGIENLLPSLTPIDTIFNEKLLPPTALFNSIPPNPAFAGITPATMPAADAPLFALGFGTPGLVQNSARLAYLEDALANPDGAVPTITTLVPAANPANPLRQAFKKNDLRNWGPQVPILMCGGDEDPTVFFFDTQVMQAYFGATGVPAQLVTVVDVDSAPSGPNDPFAAAKLGFAAAKAAVFAAGGENAVIQDYHGTLVPPFCSAVARGFFSQF